MDSKALIERIRKRWPLMRDADEHNREAAKEDMEFLYLKGKQWEGEHLQGRGDRPKYEFNELKGKCKRIINEMRANRPAGKVRAVEDGDTDTAEVQEGLLRNIWSVSRGDHITDYAAGYQVGGGMGAWRVDLQYSSDTVFDQDIVPRAIMNPLCLWWDPSAKDQLKQDAEDWFYTERISKISYERRWPNKEVVSLDEGAEHDSRDDWDKDDQVRIGEYWWREPAKKTLYLLQSGKTVEEKPAGPLADPVQREREVSCYEIWMCVVGGGNAILEKPTKWAGSKFPFIVVFGEYIVIDGKVYWYGLTRDGKDAQQALNQATTSIVEGVEQQLHNQYWATAEQAKGNLRQWAEAHKENIPVLIYNHDPKAPGPPSRAGTADVPVAQVQIAMMMADKLKSTTGVFDAALGATSNETSGRAITARQNQSEIANFHFQDNMALGVDLCWHIMMDLIPKVYDGERSIRILGSDLAEKYVKINAIDPATKKVTHDLSAGKFDLTVSVGPSWSTRRQEAVEMYGELGRSNPALWQVAGDLLFKAMDLPYSQEIAERFVSLLPPQIQESMKEGKELPAEVQQAMQQAAAAMQKVEQQSMLVQQAAAEAEKEKTEAEKAKMGVQSLLKDMDIRRAQFDADVAKQLAHIANQQAALKVLETQLETKVSQIEVQQQRDEASTESSQAAISIQQLASQFGEAAREVLQAMSEKEQQLNARIDQEISMLMQSPPPAAPVQEVPVQ